jgi:hypothetical protein
LFTKNIILFFLAGDVRIVRLVGPEELKKRSKDGKTNVLEDFINVIVFPQKGDIPITAQISGSDLDGDLYFLSWDSRLIP